MLYILTKMCYYFNSQISMKRTHKSSIAGLNKETLAWIVGITVLTLLTIGSISLYSSQKIQTDLTQVADQLPQPTVSSEPIVVDFEYTVQDISEETITLVGQNGEFLLPNDENQVELYNGASIDAPKIPLSELTTGATLNLEFIPGQLARLFLININ